MTKEKLKEKAEQMYRKKNSSCDEYACLVPNCYNAKEKKKTCIECLMRRILEKEGNKWKNISL